MYSYLLCIEIHCLPCPSILISPIIIRKYSFDSRKIPPYIIPLSFHSNSIPSRASCFPSSLLSHLWPTILSEYAVPIPIPFPINYFALVLIYSRCAPLPYYSTPHHITHTPTVPSLCWFDGNLQYYHVKLYHSAQLAQSYPKENDNNRRIAPSFFPLFTLHNRHDLQLEVTLHNSLFVPFRVVVPLRRLSVLISTFHFVCNCP